MRRQPNVMERGAIKRAEKRLAPLMEPGESIEDFDIATLRSDGRRMDLIATGKALYLIDMKLNREFRVAYETIAEISWEPDNPFWSDLFGVHFFDGQRMDLTVKHPRGLCNLVKSYVERLMLAERHVESDDGQAATFRFRPVLEDEPPIWFYFPDTGVKVDSDFGEWAKGVTESLVEETGLGNDELSARRVLEAAADEDIQKQEPLSSRAGHWPERNQSGFPQVTLGAWLWWPEMDDSENVTLKATVTPATSADQIEVIHLTIESEDRAKPIEPDEVWMYQRTDLESDHTVYELRALSSDTNDGEGLHRCLISSESPWLEDLCRYLEGYWEMRGGSPRGPDEFDAMPELVDDPESRRLTEFIESDTDREDLIIGDLGQQETSPAHQQSYEQDLLDAYDEAELVARQALLEFDHETALAATQRMSEIDVQLEELEDAPKESNSPQDEGEEATNEFDAMPLLEIDRPDEVSHPTDEQTTTVDEPARVHDSRWCSVKEASILLRPDGACPACGTRIGV